MVEDGEDESPYKVQRAAQSQPPEERFNTVARLGSALPLCRSVEVQVQGCSPVDAQTVAQGPLPRVAICVPSWGVSWLRVMWEGGGSRNWYLPVRCDDLPVPSQKSAKARPL